MRGHVLAAQRRTAANSRLAMAKQRPSQKVKLQKSIKYGIEFGQTMEYAEPELRPDQLESNYGSSGQLSSVQPDWSFNHRSSCCCCCCCRAPISDEIWASIFVYAVSGFQECPKNKKKKLCYRQLFISVRAEWAASSAQIEIIRRCGFCQKCCQVIASGQRWLWSAWFVVPAIACDKQRQYLCLALGAEADYLVLVSRDLNGGGNGDGGICLRSQIWPTSGCPICALCLCIIAEELAG